MAPIAPFLFGKLPAHGDFVSRGLGDTEREGWDHWASQAMDNLGGDAETATRLHGEVPPWRFVAGPSVLGRGWRVGALAASVDRAGRRFIAVLGLGGMSVGAAAGAGIAAAAGIEGLLYQAIGERMTAEEAVTALDGFARSFAGDLALAEALDGQPSSEGLWWTEAERGDPRTGALPPADLLVAAHREALHAG
jgi:type VI secretion system ImpM family protein